MKNNNNKIYEELLFDLPDYISGKITDRARISEIENQINSDAKFRSEYENLKLTFNTLENIKIDEPSDAFFNNLLPKIHQKINERETTDEHKVSIWNRFFPVLKYVLPVIVLIIFVYIYNIDNSTVIKKYDTLTSKSNELIINEKNIETNIDSGNLIAEQKVKENKNFEKSNSNTNDLQIINIVDVTQPETSLFFNDTELEVDDYEMDNLSEEDEEAILTILNQEL